MDYYNKNGIKIDKKNSTLTRCINNEGIEYCKTIKFRKNNPLLTINTSSSKVKTSLILEQYNIPIPKFIFIEKYTFPISKSRLNNMLFKKGLQKPYVVKIDNGSQGRGVYVDINSKSKILSIINKLFITTDTPRVIIEEFKKGEAHRILMYRNNIIDIVMKQRTKVVGDGKSNIIKLIENENKIKEEKKHPLIDVYEKDFIKKQGYNISDPIPKGKEVILSKSPHYHHGSNVIRIELNKVHPDNIVMFKKVQEIVGTELIGIDYISNDIGISWKEHGCVNEINSYPDMQLHDIPSNIKIDFKKKNY